MNTEKESNSGTVLPTRMSIFRAASAPTLAEANCMEFADISPLMDSYIKTLIEEGVQNGEHIKVLFNLPGFSLTYVWFKRNYPLPLHTHDADCLYYVIAGDLKLGTETIGRGDGFFVPENAPYTYTPGADGVELLEFRHKHQFNIKFMAKTAPFWEKALERVRTESAAWAIAQPPHVIRARV